jgi:environmental stress-induced protein Ves
MAGWRLVPASSLVAAPWRNGLGVSRDIAVRAGPAEGPTGGLGWTVSIATLERDADFSHYPHGDRVFTPIAGDPPPELAFDDGPFEACPLLVPRRFAGETLTRSRIRSPGLAFNAIVDRRYFASEVTVFRATGAMAVPAQDAADVVLHCLTGRLRVGGLDVGAGDSAVGSRLGPSQALAEDGIVLVVTIRPV